MHVLLPFDIVPEARRSEPFGVAPASERAVTYAIDVLGNDQELEITAVHLSTDSINIEENIGAARIRKMAESHGVDAEVRTQSIADADTMADLREAIVRIVERETVDTVVMGYDEDAFDIASFEGSTPDRILADEETPVVLVP
ncbi:hypothetical protein JCM18237_15870 [Halorubrum luteum]